MVDSGGQSAFVLVAVVLFGALVMLSYSMFGETLDVVFTGIVEEDSQSEVSSVTVEPVEPVETMEQLEIGDW